MLGDWKIVTVVDDQTFEKEFQVAEYVLPNFEVFIDSANHVAFKDEEIHVTVRAKLVELIYSWNPTEINNF